MMEWYIQISIYLVSIAMTLFALYQVDFNKFMRIGRKQHAIFVYVVLSLALGAMIANLFIGMGNIIIESAK